jgi:hypothetical protein
VHLQIAMGTFVLSFVGNSFVLSVKDNALFAWLTPNSSTRRRIIVLAYFSIIAAMVVLFGVTTIPDIAREAADFVKRLQSDNIWVVLVEKARHGVGYDAVLALPCTMRATVLLHTPVV